MKFTNNWFENSAKGTWDLMIPHNKPKKILEIGSYEGKSICYLIETLGNIQDLEIHAIDSWEGGQDHISKQIKDDIPMKDVKALFFSNVEEAKKKAIHKIDLKVWEGFSDIMLCDLLATGYKNYFDFIYVDGSHESSDVLFDCVVAFRMLAPGGTMAMDDYLWQVDTGAEFRPKLAIDAFTNINFYKVNMVGANNQQVYVSKKF